MSNGLVLTQKKFALDLLREFLCDNLPSMVCPLGPLSRTSTIEDPLVDATDYRNW